MGPFPEPGHTTVERVGALVLLATLWLVPGVAAQPVVETSSGSLRGLRLDDGVSAFLGVAYAAPPVGERRWRPPAPVEPWDEVREATAWSPVCPQPPFHEAFMRRVAGRLGGDPEAVRTLPDESEDCLYLNVWTPDPRDGAGRPVVVWIHGGGGTIGSAMDPMFDGSVLAAEGLVVVAVNYRLGPLGFLAHPALSAESTREVSGNYALLDLIAALRWVGREIVAFGGDPGRVTVAGQSAGAGLAAHLMTSPRAEGSFHRAILQSGTGIGLAIPLRTDDPEARSGESLGRRLADALGVAGESDVAAAMRAVPAEEVVRVAFESRVVPDRPVVDGWIVPEPVGSALAAGRWNEMPVVVGSNADETAVLVPPPASVEAYRERIREGYGEDAERVLALYPAVDSMGAVMADRRRATDDFLATPARLFARYVDESGIEAWLYRFDRGVTAPNGEEVGAFHGAELPFLFGHHPPAWSDPDSTDRAFGAMLRDIWARFASTGNPNGSDLPRWPAYEPNEPRALFLRDPPAVRPLPRLEALDLFEAELLRDRPGLRP